MALLRSDGGTSPKVGPPTPDTSDSGSDAAVEWTSPDNTLTSDAMCPNMRISPAALRYDCDAYCSHTSRELRQRMSRHQHRVLNGRGYLMAFTPIGSQESQEPPALLGGPLTGGEPASSSSGSVNPAASVLPFSMSKGKGKGVNYLTPPGMSIILVHMVSQQKMKRLYLMIMR